MILRLPCGGSSSAARRDVPADALLVMSEKRICLRPVGLPLGPSGRVTQRHSVKNRLLTELSPQTFCTFPREFSSDRRQRVLERAATLFPTRVLPPTRATCDSPFSGLRRPGCTSPWRFGRTVGQQVNTPWSRGRVRLKGISRMTRAAKSRMSVRTARGCPRGAPISESVSETISY